MSLAKRRASARSASTFALKSRGGSGCCGCGGDCVCDGCVCGAVSDTVSPQAPSSKEDDFRQWSELLTAASVPGAPRNVRMGRRTTGEVIFVWKYARPHGSELLEQEITFQRADESQSTIVFPPEATEFSVNGCPPGADVIRVQVRCRPRVVCVMWCASDV